MPVLINYQLQDAGWAQATIGNGQKQVDVTISYLHDSLGNLADSALGLLNTPEKTQTVVFMDEPGEHQLVITPAGGGLLTLELRWFDDWEWDSRPQADYKLVLQAQSNPLDFAASIQQNLENIWRENGHQGYLDKWLQHEFPCQKYLELSQRLSYLPKKGPH